MRSIERIVVACCIAFAALILVATGLAGPTSAHSRIHEGDLVIDGSEIYRIENETVTVKGDVIVKDNAQLVLYYATLIMDTAYKVESAMYECPGRGLPRQPIQ